MFRYLFCCPHTRLVCRMSTGIQLWVQVLAHQPYLFVYWPSKHIWNFLQIVPHFHVGVGAQSAFLAAPSGHLECSDFHVLLHKFKFPYKVLEILLYISVLPLAEFEVGVGRNKETKHMFIFFRGDEGNGVSVVLGFGYKIDIPLSIAPERFIETDVYFIQIAIANVVDVLPVILRKFRNELYLSCLQNTNRQTCNDLLASIPLFVSGNLNHLIGIVYFDNFFAQFQGGSA